MFCYFIVELFLGSFNDFFKLFDEKVFKIGKWIFFSSIQFLCSAPTHEFILFVDFKSTYAAVIEFFDWLIPSLQFSLSFHDAFELHERNPFRIEKFLFRSTNIWFCTNWVLRCLMFHQNFKQAKMFYICVHHRSNRKDTLSPLFFLTDFKWKPYLNSEKEKKRW